MGTGTALFLFCLIILCRKDSCTVALVEESVMENEDECIEIFIWCSLYFHLVQSNPKVLLSGQLVVSVLQKHSGSVRKSDTSMIP